MSIAQRIDYARSRINRGDRARAVDVLRTGLLHVNPTDDNTALDAATATAAALLAELTLTDGDPAAALPCAAWAYRSLQHLLGARFPETRFALKVLAAAHRRAGNLTEAANHYSDLVRHHTTAEGPRALPTLAAQATLALVLHQGGHCAQACQLLARTAATHRAVYPRHPDGTRMHHELTRMRASCLDQGHGHPQEPTGHRATSQPQTADRRPPA
ncbi:hypothetical protein ACLQ24_00425 [Micromonospora sp. DT4]|uniref:hypothetical protein n=1 Tax=Micromonospora sp. DT4 TaxID=3393438 RepID=UPI003CEC8F26